MRDIRRSFGGSVLFAYVALGIIANLLDLLLVDWKLHRLHWTVWCPVLTQFFIALALVAVIVYPLRHPAPRLFIAFLLIISMAWKFYTMYREFKGLHLISFETLPALLLDAFITLVMCFPVTSKLAEATPFYEGDFTDCMA